MTTKVRIANEIHTVERTSRAGSIEPAVGTAAAHLAVDYDTAVPRPVSLVAVLARDRGQFAGDVREERLDVAPSRQIQRLLGSALVCEPQAGVSRQALRQRALDDKVVVSRVLRQLLRGRGHSGVHTMTTHLDRNLLGRLRGGLHAVVHSRLFLVHQTSRRRCGTPVGQDVGGGAEVHVLCVAGGMGSSGSRVVVLHLRLGLSIAIAYLDVAVFVECWFTFVLQELLVKVFLVIVLLAVVIASCSTFRIVPDWWATRSAWCNGLGYLAGATSPWSDNAFHAFSFQARELTRVI